MNRPPPRPSLLGSLGLMVVLFPLFAAPAAAQGPPATDIFLLRETGSGELKVRNITERSGYDNQPHFTPDGSGILYTSQRDGQTDIYRYDLASTSAVRITSTAESEYSPTVMPGGEEFSVVRVEADSAQRLWAFDLTGENPRLLLPEIRRVGYHAWIDEGRLALFVLGTPPTLRLATPATGKAEAVAQGIGRSLHRIPGKRAISFVHKVTDEEWWIKELDPETGEIRPIIRTLEGSEDYAWTPHGRLLMGQGSSLYFFDPVGGSDWELVADLAGRGLGEITRIAVAPVGRIVAIVGVPSG